MFGNFAVRIVLPTLLTIALFVVAIFVFLLPAFERALLERRRDKPTGGR